MKLIIFFISFIISNIYSQSVSLPQIITWRQMGYHNVHAQLWEKGWEHISTNYVSSFKRDLYLLKKGTQDEEEIILIFDNNNSPENNTISYTASLTKIKNIINQIKLSKFKLIRSSRNDTLTSLYYRSDELTIITSFFENVEVSSFTINISTNSFFDKNHKF